MRLRDLEDALDWLDNHKEGVMLILSRLEHQSIIIGEGPEAAIVTVAKIDGDKVKLGIAAPPWVRVDRTEVRRRMEAEETR